MSVFSPEEINTIKYLLQNESDVDFKELFNEFLQKSSYGDDQLPTIISKVKRYISMPSLSSFTFYSPHKITFGMIITEIKKLYNCENYHYVELFILFYNKYFYDKEINNYWMNKDSFVELNCKILALNNQVKDNNKYRSSCSENGDIKDLTDPDSSNNIFKTIYKYLKYSDNGMNLDKLVLYLKEICNFEFDEDLLFRSLDKQNRGYIDEPKVDNYLKDIQEFIILCDESSNSHLNLEKCCQNITKKLFHKCIRNKSKYESKQKGLPNGNIPLDHENG